jgi:integrase
MFLLFFYGLKGEEMIEVRQLKKEDVDFKNFGVYVNRNNKNQYIKMPEKVIDIIKKTITSTEYLSIKKDGSIWYRKLCDSDYIIRTIKNSQITTKPMLTSRISNIKNKIWNNKYLTAGRIHRAGCAIFAIRLMEEEQLSQYEAINNSLFVYGLSKSLHYKVKDVVELIQNNSQ